MAGGVAKNDQRNKRLTIRYMFHPSFKVLVVMIAMATPCLLVAGTLDDAPFRVVVPNNDWKLDDSTAQPMGKDVFLVATAINAKAGLKSVVIKAVNLKESPDSALEGLCAGMRDTLSNPAVKKISDAETIFLGRKARKFTYEIAQGDRMVYNEAIVFIVQNIGWTIACVGRAEQKDEIKQLFAFYHPCVTTAK